LRNHEKYLAKLVKNLNIICQNLKNPEHYLSKPEKSEHYLTKSRATARNLCDLCVLSAKNGKKPSKMTKNRQK